MYMGISSRCSQPGIQWSPSNPDTLGILAIGQIIEVSSSQGLLIEHGCGLSLKLMM